MRTSVSMSRRDIGVKIEYRRVVVIDCVCGNWNILMGVS